MSRVEIPYLNPIKLHKIDADVINDYVSKHMDDYSYLQTILPWQQVREFGQPWQLQDRLRMQFYSSFETNILSLCDRDGDEIYNESISPLLVDADDPSMKVYQPNWMLSTIDPGVYFLKLSCSTAPNEIYPDGFSLFLISEPLKFLANHKNSLLLNYSHYQFKDDVIFETGFSPYIRIPGTLRLKPLSSKDSFFEDQVLSMQTLDSKPYRIWELSIGGASGIPDWLADRIGRILGCSTLTFDGKAFTKANENSRLEEKSAANYPMRSYTIELREAENSFSKSFSGALEDAEVPTPTIADNVKSIFVEHTGSESSAKVIQHADLVGKVIILLQRAQQPIEVKLSGVPADASEAVFDPLTGSFTAFDDWGIGEKGYVIYK